MNLLSNCSSTLSSDIMITVMVLAFLICGMIIILRKR